MGYLSGPDWTLEEPKAYYVVGCHRSGTSFVANAIRSQGVYFGSGSWRCESRDFWSIDKDIIQAAGGTWLEPPPETELLAQGVLTADRIQEVITKFSKRPLWGAKDPRMALTARSWLDLTPGDVYLIAVFRRPEYAAASLSRVGQIWNVQDAEVQVKEYARRMITAIKRFMGV